MTMRETTSLLPLADRDLWPAGLKRSWRDKLQVLAFGAIQWPWLLRSLSGGSRAAKAELCARLDLPVNALPHLGSWKADTGFLALIVDHIEQQRPRHVVELGAGASSLVIGRALEIFGQGRLTSFDQHADFVHATRDWLADNCVTADLYVAPLRQAPEPWRGIWYDLDGHLPERIDLLVIDGPPWTVHPCIRGAAETLFDRMPVGGTVLLDDGARPGERRVAARWRERWPNFRFDLVQAGTKGTLIGTRRA
ncbi:class I SAM-dependent methyltransferase [Stakelama saccharophila]|uniref:Class I SAM-dependent methyltransferase n=1 Tax=Stakelama saccharophila TaxID=3075605 RepID=A0ABZ0B8Q6_9SPHN|nr:class I SAM-dependent methyltransferase [Stakelama sp. W311]WNO53243.1 class I SAM-dependent methyltransferase [Stakelama sp. W311]